MSHTVDGQTATYTWDVAAGLPVVLQDNTYMYVYGLDLISATDSGGNQNYYMYNGLGSVTNIADYNGNEKALYFYDAFGNPRYAVELTSNVWRYTGEQRDADSGLYYLRARYYDPATGRFLGRDPAAAGHPYAYVENNPVNFVDPSGLCVEGLGVRLPCPVDQAGNALCNANLASLVACQVAEWAAGHAPECLVQEVSQGYGPEASCQLGATCAVPKNWGECRTADAIRDYATREAQLIYGCSICPQGTRANPEPSDRFRHCFSSGLMTLEFGAGLAEKLTTRYEAYRKNDPAQREYDLQNNQTGRYLADIFRDDPRPVARLAKACKE